MTIVEKIRILRKRFGLTLEQAKDALLICTVGSTADEHQKRLAEQLEEDGNITRYNERND